MTVAIATAQPAPQSSKANRSQAAAAACPIDDPGPGMRRGGMGPRMARGGPGMGMPGTWWKNSEVVKQLGLNDSQVQQVEKSFQDHRPKLIDLQAVLQKQEVALQPLVDAERPDETKVITQIDKVAQARADLEKSHAKLLLAIRRVLTFDQWKQLQSQRPHPGPMRGPGTGF